MNHHLQHLEAMHHHPALRVAPESRAGIVENILHHLMRPYFGKRTPEMQQKFGESQYQAFMQALAGYCLREYIEHPEPRLTMAFIKGLHRQLYQNAPVVPLKAVDGSMTTMVPGEFKTVTTYVKQQGEWVATLPPEEVSGAVTALLDALHDPAQPLFQRYLHFMFELMVIHPFPDSNGKAALALGDLFLLKQSLHPPYFAKYK
jgi:Fic family protein